MRNVVVRLLMGASALGCLPAAAEAQYKPYRVSEPATGERYHVEASAVFWSPTAEIRVASEGLGIPGSDIDLVADLALTDRRFREFRVVLRPGQKHKFRFHYLPMKYEASTVLKTTIVFNGIRYDIGLPVEATLDWKAYRFAYEYDLISRNRGYLGIVLEAKYTDVQVTLDSPLLGTEFAHARAPIPSLGAIGRVYVLPNISITGEFTGIKLPDGIDEDYRAQYYDFDIYGTVNFTNNVGAQVGYRSLDVSYTVKLDRGDLKLKGLYFGGVARF